MSENTISRRKVTQGIAWSAPVIAATVAAPLAAASPSLCDTEDLWRNRFSEASPDPAFANIVIDPAGVITLTEPEGWEGTWPPNIDVWYIGSDTKATTNVDDEGKVTATPPADVDPFDIEIIRLYLTPWEYHDVYRETDEEGNFICSLQSMNWSVA